MTNIELRIFDQPVRISTDDKTVARTLIACYSAFQQPVRNSPAKILEISISSGDRKCQWFVTLGDQTATCIDLSELVYYVEKLMTIELQRRRNELFFLHAAALSFDGRCLVIVGESGAGKSTLCWELCNNGFGYLSDELAPVNLQTFEVEPYPHAICLKQVTEEMPSLPDMTVSTGLTMHIPVESIPGAAGLIPSSIDLIIFLDHSKSYQRAQLKQMRRAEAAARIYANGLNQLAHAADGLVATSKIASAARCFSLSRGRLAEMRHAILGAMNPT